VGRINGEHGTIGWSPIWYLYRWMPFDRLVALYSVADVALVTPLRDGMNLIAKEYLAANTGATGVLVLSEMAGAASELGEAITVNPNNKRALIEAIQQALQMPTDEQLQRNKRMQDRLSRYTVHRWARDFLDALERTKRAQQRLVVKNLSPDAAKQLVAEFRESRKRLLLLDYDGTLVRFFKKAEDAVPDPQLLELLRDLARSPDNTVVLVSGRDRATLDAWFAGLGISLVAEHGGWIREAGTSWEPTVGMDAEWTETIRPILDLYADRTPGSSVEEKNFALVWHFRAADPELAGLRRSELRDAVHDLTANLDVGVFEGDKIFEIKRTGVDKGRAVMRWLRRADWDFILAIGDDYTDEDMFGALPLEAYSIKVGRGMSRARFSLRSVDESRQLLARLIGS
jgi:trehalose 6-phosphate synthase/phosphatase